MIIKNKIVYFRLIYFTNKVIYIDIMYLYIYIFIKS